MKYSVLVIVLAMVLSLCSNSTVLADWSYTILPQEASWIGAEGNAVLGPDLQGGTAWTDQSGQVDPSSGVIWGDNSITTLIGTKSKVYDMADIPGEGLYKVGQSGSGEKATVWNADHSKTVLPGQTGTDNHGSANSMSYLYDSSNNLIKIAGGEKNGKATFWFDDGTSGWVEARLSTDNSTVNDVKGNSFVGHRMGLATKWELGESSTTQTQYYMSGNSSAGTMAYSQAGSFVGGSGYLNTTNHTVAVLWQDVDGVTENHFSIMMHPDDDAILSEIRSMDQYDDGSGNGNIVSGGWVAYLSDIPGVYAEVNAALWVGPDNDYVNLHIPEYEGTSINDIIVVGDKLYAVGTASIVNTGPYVSDAVLWTYEIPEPATITVLIAGFAGVVIRRKKFTPHPPNP